MMHKMKFNFPLPTDNKVHIYCITCNTDGTLKTRKNNKTVFVCPNGHDNERGLHYGGVKFEIGEDNELLHESIGVFVRNKDRKLLFIDRTEYPFGIAIPAGHIDDGETPEQAAKRELMEETGIKADKLKLLFSNNILDSCSGGSDKHRWHGFGVILEPNQTITINHEGINPVWLDLKEAAKRPTPPIIQYILYNFSDAINNW